MDLEAIQKRARSDLVLRTCDGGSDVFLWEHSLRVAVNARQIARLPEARAWKADEMTAFLAGLYHDAGWAVRVREGEVDRTEVLIAPTSESDCALGAGCLALSLKGLVPEAMLERAAMAVRTRCDRASQVGEAVVLAEAEALDEFGVLPVWVAVRKGLAEGRGVAAAVETWVRKREYHFWRARLADSFRFETVRMVAAARLERLERLLAEVQIEHLGTDLAQAVGGVPREVLAGGFPVNPHGKQAGGLDRASDIR